MDLDHLNLRVADADACREFYERHFGFRLSFEAEGGWFLRNDAGFLLAPDGTETEVFWEAPTGTGESPIRLGRPGPGGAQ